MTEREPQLFKNWSGYMRQRQAMASAVIFKNHGWYKWEVGHAKLYGILLWHYEMKKQTRFKYSKTLKMQGYRRTHNYRLLKAILEKELLQKEGSGYYSFAVSEVKVIEKVLSLIKGLDMIGNKKEVR
jgi:hypothetical protein